MMCVIVEWPGAERIVRNIERINPCISGADSVGATAMMRGFCAERPGTV